MLYGRADYDHCTIFMMDPYGVMTSRYTDYIPLKTGGYQSVGKFGDDIYAYEVNYGQEMAGSMIYER